MAHNLGTEESPIPVFVAVNGGMVDAIVRCPSREVFDTVAEMVGLRYELTETVIDEETGEESQVGTGEFRYAPGIDVDHLGPVTITPGTYDADGAEITPPVVDARHHVNFRMGEPAVSRLDEHGDPIWWQWALAWTVEGVNDDHPNSAEVAKTLYDVTLIDPDTIRSPARVFL